MKVNNHIGQTPLFAKHLLAKHFYTNAKGGIRMFAIMGAAIAFMAGQIPAFSQDSNSANENAANINQETDNPTQTPAIPYPADLADVETIDAILTALYDVISGPANEARDWDRFYSLFVDGARLIPQAQDSATGVSVLSPTAYVERAEPFFLENGFFETEIGRKIDRFGNIVQVFSAYESRNSLDDPKPFARGINSIQLQYHNDRWWVVTIFWQGESQSLPIPPDYIGQ